MSGLRAQAYVPLRSIRSFVCVVVRVRVRVRMRVLSLKNDSHFFEIRHRKLFFTRVFM